MHIHAELTRTVYGIELPRTQRKELNNQWNLEKQDRACWDWHCAFAPAVMYLLEEQMGHSIGDVDKR